MEAKQKKIKWNEVDNFKLKLTKSLFFVCISVFFSLSLFSLCFSAHFLSVTLCFILCKIKRMVHTVRSVQTAKGIALFCVFLSVLAGMCWDNLVASMLRFHLFQLSMFPCGWTRVQSQVMVILPDQIQHQ